MIRKNLNIGNILYVLENDKIHRSEIIKFEELNTGHFKSLDLLIKVNKKIIRYGIESFGKIIFFKPAHSKYYYYSHLSYHLMNNMCIVEYDITLKFIPYKYSNCFEGFIHATSLDNFKKIIESGYIYSRNKLRDLRIEFTDNADAGVIQYTRNILSDIFDYVRFYYYFDTPTLYNFDVPIIIVISQTIIEYINFYKIYNGNAAAINSLQTSNLDIAKKFDWDTIFERGPYNSSSKVTTRQRNAEFAILDSVPLIFIDKIYFRDDITMLAAKKFCNETLISKFILDRSKFK